MGTKKLKVIGNSVLITVSGVGGIPAKVDTGAESSSIWASDITLNDAGQLEFCLFAPESEFYTGERIVCEDYSAMLVRNSTGEATVRYRVKLPVTIKRKRIRAGFTLSDRSRNNFPVLIGRRLLKNRFLVDVSRLDVPYPPRTQDMQLNEELEQDPKAFHETYFGKANQNKNPERPAKA